VSRAAALLLGSLLLVAGCGAPDDETMRAPTASPSSSTNLADLPVGTGDVGPGNRVRCRDSVLRIDERPMDLAPLRVDECAAVVGGVFFLNGRELWFTDLVQARATGYTDAESVVASPDGRRVAFLDLEHGPRDHYGTPLAMSIAYDATTGKPLVASYAGMGDVGSDDLTDLYEDAEPRILRFDGDTLVVRGATGGDQRIPLDGSAIGG
jgi:hypothetical protein